MYACGRDQHLHEDALASAFGISVLAYYFLQVFGWDSSDFVSKNIHDRLSRLRRAILSQVPMQALQWECSADADAFEWMCE